jgi:hypothetical protein
MRLTIASVGDNEGLFEMDIPPDRFGSLSITCEGFIPPVSGGKLESPIFVGGAP